MSADLFPVLEPDDIDYAMSGPDPTDDPPEDTADPVDDAPVPSVPVVEVLASDERMVVAAPAFVIPEPSSLIHVDGVLASLEGITAADKARAIVLGHQAQGIAAIADDDTEVLVGALIDEMTAHQSLMEGKIRPFADLAYKLHRGLTGFIGASTSELVTGLARLRPMLARRLRDKEEAERARQREEAERARKAEQDRLLAEAAHAESVGEAPETVAAIVEEAATVPAPMVAARPVTAVRGASTRDNWKAELTDMRLLVCAIADRLRATPSDASLLNLVALDQTAANQTAKAQKSTMNIPGLKAVNDVGLTKRR